jgi:hypothetical protein
VTALVGPTRSHYLPHSGFAKARQAVAVRLIGMVAAALNRHPCGMSKHAGLAPMPASIWPIISAFYLPIYLPFHMLFLAAMLQTAHPAGMYTRALAPVR